MFLVLWGCCIRAADRMLAADQILSPHSGHRGSVMPRKILRIVDRRPTRAIAQDHDEAKDNRRQIDEQPQKSCIS